ncbi:phosphate/phosphite/phosphonate ABC transporter substrate-binding protein [Gemella sp. GH3]|uniref:phosphate/phosphite/phosphonate ABC transporter substrate-binding protein n=1 Tax=unclassified Gemella TaxID=2624949 RepID=UPI0015D071DB|nr:phosphate/phosphite/phosphonate ABC transporter substrate-binding protein [Gemella sp. GH3.1]NYS50520.1 phosphate/phosphite/phosphonate ABC transporter substrate-binding protein [Gemella sp. GH3]
MKKLLSIIVSLCLIFVLASCSNNKKEEKVIKMGFVPLNNSETLIEDVKPIADALGKKLGVKIEAYTASNYIGFVEGIGSGSVDFGFMPPFAYLLAKEQQAKPILTAKGKTGEPGYYSYLYTRKDAGINSLEDVRGKKVAFVDPSSTSGYIYPGAMLVKEGLSLENDVTTQFTGGHDKSLQLLVNGDVDVIGSYDRIVERYEKEFPSAKENVVVLKQSNLIPGITIVASNSLDEETQKKLKEAFKELENDKETMELFTKLFNITGFTDVNEDYYKEVEETAKIMNVDLKKVK